MSMESAIAKNKCHAKHDIYRSSSQSQHLQRHCFGGIRIRENGVQHSGHLPVKIGCQPHSASIAGS